MIIFLFMKVMEDIENIVLYKLKLFRKFLVLHGLCSVGFLFQPDRGVPSRGPFVSACIF